jgi:tetratricopeptide (TPR) repeat protein
MRVFFVFAVLTALLIYSTGLWAPFHLDDPTVVRAAETANSWTSGQNRALGYFSFWINRQVMLVIGSVLPWTEPFYYRLVNILIHAVAATALFWLLHEITEQWQLAAVGGALFLVHPIQTQAVTYISQRFESEAAMFMFLAAAAYVRFRKTRVTWWAFWTALFGLAAALTKETAVALPLWLCLIEVTFFEGAARLRKYAAYLVGLAILLFIPALRAFEGASRNLFAWISWDQYFLNQGPILTKYFELATWPRHQFLFYDFPLVNALSGVVVLQWLLVLGIAGLGAYLLKSKRLIGFGILTFFILLLPVVLLPLPDLINEHRLYPSFAGVAIAAAGCIQAVNRKWVFAAAGVLLVLFGVKTASRNSDWNDQLKFLESHQAAFPHDPQILSRLASYYFTSGYVNKSIELNLEARKYENRFNTYYSQQGHLLTAINLSTAYLAKQNLPAAETEARRAIAAKPTEPFAWRALGYVQLQERDFRGATASFRKYAALAPNPEAWQGLQIAARQSGDLESAKLADEKLKIEENKAVAEEGNPPGIPKQYKSYAIFGITMLVLAAAAWGLWTIWSAVRLVLRPPTVPAFVEESRKLPDGT